MKDVSNKRMRHSPRDHEPVEKSQQIFYFEGKVYTWTYREISSH